MRARTGHSLHALVFHGASLTGAELTSLDALLNGMGVLVIVAGARHPVVLADVARSLEAKRVLIIVLLRLVDVVVAGTRIASLALL